MEQQLYEHALALLKQLVATPSFSKQEAGTASLIGAFLERHGIPFHRSGNNIIAKNKTFDPARPSLLLNSHHDTVQPNKGYSVDPFAPTEKDGKLFGLGSNDAGGCLVSLVTVFLHFYARESMAYNLVLAATAEEEISGANGIELALRSLGPIDCAIVGEPTLMEMAVAERGLMVVDCVATGVAGHAARNEGENALYKALDDINWIRNHSFARISPFLGPTRITATVIETENRQHNVVPAQCRFVLDARVNELYSFEEVLEPLRAHMASELSPRSMRLRSTSIDLDHPLVRAGLHLGKGYYGSPTTSDKALMPFPALKMGPGDSARSHSADEFIYLHEIAAGIETYIRLIEQVV